LNLATAARGGSLVRSRTLGVTLMATLVLSLSAPVAAQDSTESPSTAPAASVAPSADGIDFPVMIGGQLLTAETFTGPEWLAQFDDGAAESVAYAEKTEALTESVGKTIDDLTVKSALYEPSPGNHAAVVAFDIEGVDARDYVEDAIGLLLGDVVSPGLVLRPIGNKWVLRVVDATMPGVYPRTVYLKDDTAWIIEGDEDYVWDALDQLPDPDPVGLTEADSISAAVPMGLDGRRRIGFYESTEPLFLPTLGERLGTRIESWLLDLYMEAGISPSELIGVYAWWGLPTPQDGLQIEGYRLPPGGEDFLERLRTDVFLARPDESAETPDELDQLLAGVGFSEQEIAGRTVTTLDYGASKQHIFASGDSIWVVTDATGDDALVEEAIAALP
jgi:hypothetical protein